MSLSKYIVLALLLFTAPSFTKMEAGSIKVSTLGTESTDKSRATSVNQSGVVVGRYTDNNKTCDFMWSADEGLQVLTDESIENSTPPSINNNGQIAGVLKQKEKTSYWGYFERDVLVSQFYLYDKEEGVKVIGKPKGWDEINVIKLHDNGQIFVFDSALREVARWDNGQFHLLTKDSDVTEYPLFVNSFGDSLVANPYESGFALKTADGNLLSIKNIDQKTFTGSFVALNDRQEALCYHKRPNSIDGYLWSPEAGMKFIGTLLPRSLNNYGEIVGLYLDSTYFTLTLRPCLYVDEKIIDLNKLIDIEHSALAGFEKLTDVTGINDAGLITGTATIAGKTHAVVLEPLYTHQTR